MRTRSAFRFFTRCHSNGTPINQWNIVSLHWPWSLTWRFVISWARKKPHGHKFYFRRTNGGRGFNFSAGFNLPIVGNLSIETQPNMAKD